VNFLKSADHAQAVVDDILSAGGMAMAVQADVAKEADVVRMFAEVDERLGPPGALVNNAGGGDALLGPLGRPIGEVGEMEILRVMSVNLFGSIYCAREAIRRMSTKYGGKGGVIVNISSKAAQLGGLTGLVLYAAAKGAIDSFTIGLAKEVADAGIRVNAIRPGITETEDLRNALEARGTEFADRVLQTVPLKRPGRPDEIAKAVLFLLSEQSSYMTGAIVDVSGGR
jgi:NAD(P)-dependent dehydrogenase (short-subunit alcohol dehydrogenase family)